jgi:hypothetical protein
MEFEIFESESKNVRASGYKKQGNRFIILKGSYAVDDSMLKKSFFGHTKSYESIRNDLINTGKLKKYLINTNLLLMSNLTLLPKPHVLFGVAI